MLKRNVTRILVIAAITTLVTAGVTSIAIGGAHTASGTSAGLPLAQLSSIARVMVSDLGDHKVQSAWVIATTKYAAEQATYPGSEPLGPINPRAFLIAIRGRFVCETCSRPPDAKAPRGRFAYDIWVPNQGVTDSGLQPHINHALSRLGRIVTLPLTQPTLPAAELALRPTVGIGPARIGAKIATLHRRIGPAIAAGQWVLGPLQLGISSDRRNRVTSVAVLSPQATVDGHPLTASYVSLREALTGWQSFHCKNGPYVLRQMAANGVSTWLEFERGRFNLAYIGPVPADRCWAPVN